MSKLYDCQMCKHRLMCQRHSEEHHAGHLTLEEARILTRQRLP
jgi:hypothetical protein